MVMDVHVAMRARPVLQERQTREGETDRDADGDADDVPPGHARASARRTSIAVKTTSTTVGR